jgi:hypothetical protein
VATSLLEMPLLAIVVSAYGFVSYWMVGLNPKWERFGIFLLTVYLVVCVGFSVAQAAASASKHVNMAIAVYMIVLVYSLLMGGFIVGPDDLQGGKWVLFTSYFWFGYECLICNEFEGEEVTLSI